VLGSYDIIAISRDDFWEKGSLMRSKFPQSWTIRTWKVICLSGLLIAMGLAGCAHQPVKTSPTAVASQPPMPTKTPKPTFTPYPTETPEPTVTNTRLLPTPTATPVPITPTPTVDPYRNPLTGLPVKDPALVSRRVLAVRIGNDPSIRPQEGLGQAEVVYEEIMDGWTLTRFTALFLAASPERVRPIRSARLVSLQIVPQYDAALVHSGASDKIRWLISQASFVDLDQYFHPEPYGILEGYDWRGRMYTSVEAVHAYLEKKGWERDVPIRGYTFDAVPPTGQPATQIHIPYPDLCIVDWEYDSDRQAYLRFVRGQPHLDALTDEQIAASNVIVLYAEHRKTDIVEDSLGSTAIDIVLQGSGRAQLVRDGVWLEATWQQDTPGALIQYYDQEGTRIPLHPGNTWIELVPVDYEVEIQ